MLLGIPISLIGIVAAVYAPLEFYPLYMFSEGGRFNYPGFGFGSFMFGNIAMQILGYYLVALIFIPLGYGHLRRRRWVRKVALALLWFWLIVGAPLALLFLMMLLSVKEYSLVISVLIVISTALSYFALPLIMIRFYRREDVRWTLENADPRANKLDQIPVRRLVLILLFGFYLVFLHIPLFFRGIFPFFGQIWLHLEGIFLVGVALWSLAILLFGVVKSKRWAWWGSLAYFLLLLINTILTYARVSYSEILEMLRFPDTEMDILRGIPLSSYHLMVAFSLPLFLTLIAIFVSRTAFFLPESNDAQSADC
jgi:hypothetical protein